MSGTRAGEWPGWDRGPEAAPVSPLLQTAPLVMLWTPSDCQSVMPLSAGGKEGGRGQAGERSCLSFLCEDRGVLGSAVIENMGSHVCEGWN